MSMCHERLLNGLHVLFWRGAELWPWHGSYRRDEHGKDGIQAMNMAKMASRQTLHEHHHTKKVDKFLQNMLPMLPKHQGTHGIPRVPRGGISNVGLTFTWSMLARAVASDKGAQCLSSLKALKRPFTNMARGTWSMRA